MKMYCIFSKESIAAMGGNRGKMAAQAGHAFLHAFWDAEEIDPEMAKVYKKSGAAKKVTLVVDTTEELVALHATMVRRFIGATLVKDAARTVFKTPTVTCVGIGPVPDDYDCETLKSLKVLI